MHVIGRPEGIDLLLSYDEAEKMMRALSVSGDSRGASKIAQILANTEHWAETAPRTRPRPSDSSPSENAPT